MAALINVFLKYLKDVVLKQGRIRYDLDRLHETVTKTVEICELQANQLTELRDRVTRVEGFLEGRYQSANNGSHDEVERELVSIRRHLVAIQTTLNDAGGDMKGLANQRGPDEEASQSASISAPAATSARAPR